MHRPRKLDRAMGRKSGRPYCRHLPGDLMTGERVSRGTLWRWMRQGYISAVGRRFILTAKGARLLTEESSWRLWRRPEMMKRGRAPVVK